MTNPKSSDTDKSKLTSFLAKRGSLIQMELHPDVGALDSSFDISKKSQLMGVKNSLIFTPLVVSIPNSTPLEICHGLEIKHHYSAFDEANAEIIEKTFVDLDELEEFWQAALYLTRVSKSDHSDDFSSTYRYSTRDQLELNLYSKSDSWGCVLDVAPGGSQFPLAPEQLTELSGLLEKSIAKLGDLEQRPRVSH
ncbi:MAG: hypothetical protein ACI87E_002199 [Mariniblastus sp.]|jgi:hypothetical protein